MPVFGTAREFLNSETLAHFISTHHHDLKTVTTKNTVGDAMKALNASKILSVPILDEDGEYAGAISVGDVLRGLIRSCEANLGEDFVRNIANITADEMDGVGNFFAGKSVTSLLHEADLWMKGDAETNLMSVLKEGFHIENLRVHHRIFVCDPAKATHHLSHKGATTVVNIPEGTEKDSASSWVPTDVVSQWDMVSLLWEKRDELKLSTATATVQELGMVEGAVLTVPGDIPALVAFEYMAKDHKSCVGIVENGKLIGNLSVSDLRGLDVEHFAILLLPVAEVVAILHGKGPSLAEALSGTRMLHPATEVLKDIPLISLKPTDTFMHAVDLLVNKRLHRVWVTGDAGEPLTVITLTDVLRLVSGHTLPHN